MCMRFWPEWEWLKRVVSEGHYGKVRSAVFRRVGTLPGGWFRDGKLSGGLRTSHAISEAVTAEQVLGSIIMFSVIYLFLFVLWIMLLNSKIQKGPEPVATADQPPSRGLIDAATSRVDQTGQLLE